MWIELDNSKEQLIWLNCKMSMINIGLFTGGVLSGVNVLLHAPSLFSNFKRFLLQNMNQKTLKRKFHLTPPHFCKYESSNDTSQ